MTIRYVRIEHIRTSTKTPQCDLTRHIHTLHCNTYVSMYYLLSRAISLMKALYGTKLKKVYIYIYTEYRLFNRLELEMDRIQPCANFRRNENWIPSAGHWSASAYRSAAAADRAATRVQRISPRAYTVRRASTTVLLRRSASPDRRIVVKINCRRRSNNAVNRIVYIHAITYNIVLMKYYHYTLYGVTTL